VQPRSGMVMVQTSVNDQASGYQKTPAPTSTEMPCERACSGAWADSPSKANRPQGDTSVSFGK
jgi:hypothetical protein